MGGMPWLRVALPVQRLFLAPRNLVCSLPSRSLLNHRPSLSRSGHIQIYSRIAASLDASVPHQHSRSLSTNLETEGRESASTNNEVTADYSAWKWDSSGPEIANKCEAPAVDWLRLSERDLLMHCKLDTFRASGPGGQHRNKTESAVRIRHLPTALVAQASEDRSQHNNRVVALNRLRQLIAIEVRRPVELEGYKAPHELMRILPSSPKARRDLQRIGANHPDFVLGLQALLDLLSTVKGSISECAALLEISTGALSRLIFSDRFLWTAVNNLRASHKLKPLRGD